MAMQRRLASADTNLRHVLDLVRATCMMCVYTVLYNIPSTLHMYACTY